MLLFFFSIFTIKNLTVTFSWYDPGDREVLVDDIKVLIDFCKAMLTEDTYEKKKKERSLVTFYDTDYADPQHQKPLGTPELPSTIITD